MNIMPWQAILDGLSSWAATITGQTIFWEDQRNKNAPRPSTDYISMRVISGPRKEGSFDEVREDTGVFYLSGQRSFTVSVQAYGAAAMMEIQALQDYLESIDTLAAFNTIGIALTNDPDIQNLSEKLDTYIEDRFQMDLIFNTSQNIALVGLDSIGKVEVSGTFDKDKSSELDVVIDIEEDGYTPPS